MTGSTRTLMHTASILITGCSSGIGYHTAHGLRRRCYRVFATARRDEDVQLDWPARGWKASRSIWTPVNPSAVPLTPCWSAPAAAFYALINNGAFGLPGAVETWSREALRAQFETNVFGTQELTNLVLPAMRQHNEGRHHPDQLAARDRVSRLSRRLQRLEVCAAEALTVYHAPGTARYQHSSAADRTGADHQPFSRQRLSRLPVMDRQIRAARTAAITRRWKRLGGTLGPALYPAAEAVLKRVVHALEAHRPQNALSGHGPDLFFAATRRLHANAPARPHFAAVSGGGRR